MSAGRYVRKDATRIPVEAVLLAPGDPGEVLAFIGAGDHDYDPEAGVLSLQTRQGYTLPVSDGSYVVRHTDGQVTHMPAEAFEAAFEPEFATGGTIPAYGAGDDSVPALLEPGETSTRSRRKPRSWSADAGEDASTTGDSES